MCFHDKKIEKWKQNYALPLLPYNRIRNKYLNNTQIETICLHSYCRCAQGFTQGPVCGHQEVEGRQPGGPDLPAGGIPHDVSYLPCILST